MSKWTYQHVYINSRMWLWFATLRLAHEAVFQCIYKRDCAKAWSNSKNLFQIARIMENIFFWSSGRPSSKPTNLEQKKKLILLFKSSLKRKSAWIQLQFHLHIAMKTDKSIFLLISFLILLIHLHISSLLPLPFSFFFFLFFYFECRAVK